MKHSSFSNLLAHRTSIVSISSLLIFAIFSSMVRWISCPGFNSAFFYGTVLLIISTGSLLFALLEKGSSSGLSLSVYSAALSFLLYGSDADFSSYFIFLFYMAALCILANYGALEAVAFGLALIFMYVLSVLSGSISGGFSAEEMSVLSGTVPFIIVAEMILRSGRRRLSSLSEELGRIKSGIEYMDNDSEAKADRSARKHEIASELERKLEDLVTLVGKVFASRSTVFFSMDHKSNELYIRSACSESGRLDMNARIKTGKGNVGWVAVKKQSLLAPARKIAMKDLGYYSAEEDIHSFLGAPVIVGSQMEGVLSADHTEEGAFSEADIAMIQSFARHAGELIETSRILNSVEEESLELKALYDSSRILSSRIKLEIIEKEIFGIFRKVADFDAGILAMDDGGSGFRIVSSEGMQQGISFEKGTWLSWFTENRDEPLLIKNKKGSPKEMPFIFAKEKTGKNASFLALPLFTGDCVKGVAALISENTGFSGKEINALSVLANHTAVVMDNAMMYKRMEELAVTDGLTGLYNHRYFQQTLEEEIKRAKRTEQEVSLILMDIDFFKSFNDTYGHPAGDEILRSLGRIVREETREIDTPARYGGEEFAVILVDTGIEGAETTARRMRKRIEKAVICYEGKELTVTVSIGFATYPMTATNKAELIDGADKALYQSKTGGRNRCTGWNGVKTVE